MIVRKGLVRGLYLSALVLIAPAGLWVGQLISGPSSLYLH